MPEIKCVICCKCGAIKSGSLSSARPEEISHGYCLPCRNAELEEIERMRHDPVYAALCGWKASQQAR